MTTAIPHLTEDDLVLHYYGEVTSAQEAAASAHLDACSRCRGEYTRLQQVLGAIDESALRPDMPPAFEGFVWARLQPTLRRGGRSSTSWLLLSPAPLALAATVALLVVGAFFAGRALSPPPAVTPGAPPGAAEQIRERILLVDLTDHLDRSQMVLVELVTGDPDSDIDVRERTGAEQLVMDNRLYRQTAAETGDAAVAELLDELDRVLTDLAASPEPVSAQDLAEVRRRIDSRDLLFKVRVVSSQIRERQTEALQRRTGPRS